MILHEIESGYEKEWEILKLPVKLTGFILLHIPIPQKRTFQQNNFEHINFWKRYCRNNSDSY